MEYTEQQKQIYNDVCNKYKHNWLNTTISQTMAMEMISKALTIPVVVKSLPTKKTMDLGEWMIFNKITENGCGGYKWDGVNFSAYKIGEIHKAYKS
tara:strand:+ start:271 stop:558 length:288 start_codon:yes stop_codon:yes gene_type:complete